MQVQETLAEGLKREFKVVVPAAELDAKVDTRLADLKDRVQIRGFRPGKVPVTHLKNVYGRSVLAETIDATVQETNAKIVSDNGFRVAAEPKVTLPTEESEVKALIEGKADLTYTIALEILPKIEIADLRGIKLEKPVAQVADAEVDEALDKLVQQNRPYAAKGEGAKAEKGDRVIVSFTGTIDGEAFEGGTAEDITVEIGSNSFIPGFEEQLIGMAEGETRTVNVTFPPNYLNDKLAGKDAVFEVTAKAVQAPGTLTVDDEFAKTIGMELLARLKDAIKDRIQREHTAASRRRVKRRLLDALDERHKFDLPPSLLEEEFNNVWRTVESDLQTAGPHLRRRGHDRGRGQGRIPEAGGAARAARSRAGRDRREERDQGHRRRGEPIGGREGAAVPRPRAAGLGLLSQEPADARLPARAPLRGEGGRLSARAGERQRQGSLARRTLQGRRGRGGPAGRARLLTSFGRPMVMPNGCDAIDARVRCTAP